MRAVTGPQLVKRAGTRSSPPGRPWAGGAEPSAPLPLVFALGRLSSELCLGAFGGVGAWWKRLLSDEVTHAWVSVQDRPPC